MELREKIKKAFRRTFTPRAYERTELLKQLTPEQRATLAELQQASANYQEVYDSRSGFAHLLDRRDLTDATLKVALQYQSCWDESIPQALIDHYTPPIIVHHLKKLGGARVLPTGQGMAS
jgi:hypothetical protein